MKKKVDAKKNQLVVPLGSGWAVKSEGSADFSIIADRKSDAIAFATGSAASNNADVIIYAKDGSIKERRSPATKDAAVAK